jgi:hypothetical protein
VAAQSWGISARTRLHWKSNSGQAAREIHGNGDPAAAVAEHWRKRENARDSLLREEKSQMAAPLREKAKPFYFNDNRNQQRRASAGEDGSKNGEKTRESALRRRRYCVGKRLREQP